MDDYEEKLPTIVVEMGPVLMPSNDEAQRNPC